MSQSNKITCESTDEGVVINFPAEMSGRALVLVDSGLGHFTNGWSISNGSLAAIPQELVCQLAALHWPQVAHS